MTKQRPLKLKEIAVSLKVDPSHISRIFSLKSRPSPELAEKLELLLGVDRIVWLYPGKNNNPFVDYKNKPLKGKSK